MGYIETVESNLDGLEAISVGVCPGCEECQDRFGFDTLEDLNVAWENGDACDEGSFSSSGCGVCGSSLGGDNYTWHAIIPDKEGSVIGQEILHFDDCCTDCAQFLANGDVPEQWEDR